MTEQDRDDELAAWTKNSLERHAQTVLVLVLVALLLWVGQTTQQTALAVAELKVQIVYMQSEMDKPDTIHNDLARRVNMLEEIVLKGPGKP